MAVMDFTVICPCSWGVGGTVHRGEVLPALGLFPGGSGRQVPAHYPSHSAPFSLSEVPRAWPASWGLLWGLNLESSRGRSHARG